jgi:uncharacterized protein (DUF1697 family)
MRIGIKLVNFFTEIRRSAIADLLGWVKERKTTTRNSNLIIELLQSFSLTKCDRRFYWREKR